MALPVAAGVAIGQAVWYFARSVFKAGLAVVLVERARWRYRHAHKP